MKVDLQLPFEHGLLFLSDPYSDDDVPEDTSAADITSTQTCIAFQLPSYIDGDAHVIISSEPYMTDKIPVFSQVIEVPSSVISVSDSRRFNYCMLPIRGAEAHIEIWNFGKKNESKWIRISPLDIF